MPSLKTYMNDLKKRSYWFKPKFFNQLKWSYVNYPIRVCIGFKQKRTGSWGLPFL